jgi:hypothetical protein
VALPSFFDAKERDALLARIRSLRPDSPRRWGKMDAAQMLAHVRATLRVALGEVRLRRIFLGYLFGGLAKRSLRTDEPFRKDLPTHSTFVVKDPRDFAAERDAVVALVERLSRGGPAALTKDPHAFYGPLTTAEWDALMWKHLDHHLRQFGA